MANLPKIKKKITSFLVGEEGKISKGSLLKAGTAIGSIAIGISMFGSVAAHTSSISHGNTLSVSYSVASSAITGSHTHHANHASHGSHGSHASHGSHGSHASHGSHGSHSSY